MDKKKVISEIEAYLVDEMAVAAKAGEEERTAEIQRQLTMYRFLPNRPYGKEDVIIPSALVELDLGGTTAFYLIVPQGGGLVTKVEEKPVQVITPNSPLGEALLGKKMGDTVQVEIRGKTRNYKVLSLT